MFYNINTQELVASCPLDGYLPDGSLVQGLNIVDTATQKLCGILPVISDIPTQPENTIEDISQRDISILEDGVYVTRSWIPSPLIVPPTISARQVRLWLLDNGVSLAQVEAAIDTISEPLLRDKTRVEWEYAPYIERSHPLIESLSQLLGLSPTQVDYGFVVASQL